LLPELHRSENDLAQEHLQVSERHKVDQEIYHLARDWHADPLKRGCFDG
jgi:hypothetical protein